ncbi:carbohydrate kinase [Chitinibacter tainanensis]|uniref:carbohydrate kinase family protein n=1 Tax=Chitinibacter tainanensis TaxID=230667 RepID=UPI0023527536|nr:carbohydrate kinase [Chitinibacter tainanensis]
MSHAALPRCIAAGEALTDLIRTNGEQWVSKVGGSTWNVARVMASLGLPTAFAGAISTDCFGQDLQAASVAAGLDLRYLQTVAQPPLLAIVHQQHPPQYFFIGENSADLAFNWQALPQGWESATDWLHFGGISLAREPLASHLVEMARHAKLRGVRISYDPNYRVLMGPSYQATLASMSALADVIKVSDEDLAGLFPGLEMAAALAALRELNPQAMVLFTRGAAGASLISGEQTVSAPAIPVAVVDTVGAGDAAMGGLIYSLLTQPEQPLAQHLHFSLACGAAACAQQGATPPTLAQVQKLLTS